MGYFYSFLFPWNFILQGIAIVHFIRRRPDNYWLWIILVGGGLGAVVYIVAEVLPDLGILRQSFKAFPRRRRIRELEAIILDNPSAGTDLERVLGKDQKYDFHRAAGLLAYSYAQTGQTEKADALFKKTTQISTLSETYMNYANFLAAQGRTAEAREWTQRILAKKPTLPGYLRRRERPWFRKAKGLLKQLPAS